MGKNAEKMGRVIGSFLTLSLADNLLAFSRVVSISLETTGLYLVYGVRISKTVSIRAVRRILPEGTGFASPEFVAQAVSQFIRDEKIAGAEFVFYMPREWALIRTARFPQTVKEYLSSVVKNEFDRLTPLSPDNAFYDFSTLEEDEVHLTLLIAAVKREMIERYLEALRNHSIQITKVSVSPFAIAHLIRRIYPHQNYIFVAADETAYECGTVVHYSPVFSMFRTVLSWDDARLDQLAGEIRKQTDTAAEKGFPSRIVIWSKDDLYARLKEKLNNVALFHANRDLKTDWAQKGKDISARALGGFLESVETGERSFNLLAGESDKTNRKPFWLTWMLLAGIACICAFYYVAPLVIEQDKVEQIDLQLNALKPEIKKIERLQKDADLLASDIKMIDNFKKQGVLSIDVLKELTVILPEKAWLTRMRVTENSAEIEGYAAKATEIIPRLESSRLFQKAEFASPTFRDQRTNTDRFFIKMDLKNTVLAAKKRNAGEKNGEAK